MHQLCALDYEIFVRKAFGYPNQTMLGRHGDFAGLADADLIRHGKCLNQAKVGVAYGLEILRRALEPKEYDPQQLDEILSEILNVTKPEELCEIIDKINKEVVNKYFTTDKETGALILK